MATRALDPDAPPRESQRPTVPVPGAANLGFHRDAPAPPQQAIATMRAPASEVCRVVSLPMSPSCPEPSTRRPTSLDGVPHVACSAEELLVARLDHREGFVVSLLDGRSSVEAVIDACPMPEDETRRILLELQMRGLVAIRRTRS